VNFFFSFVFIVDYYFIVSHFVLGPRALKREAWRPQVCRFWVHSRDTMRLKWRLWQVVEECCMAVGEVVEHECILSASRMNNVGDFPQQY